MQNSNEEDFKKKYFKYKEKYLELKNLLGGVITFNDIKEKCDKELDKDKCTNHKFCKKNSILSGCNFDKDIIKMNDECLKYGNSQACTYNPKNKCTWKSWKGYKGNCEVDYEQVWADKKK